MCVFCMVMYIYMLDYVWVECGASCGSILLEGSLYSYYESFASSYLVSFLYWVGSMGLEPEDVLVLSVCPTSQPRTTPKRAIRMLSSA